MHVAIRLPALAALTVASGILLSLPVASGSPARDDVIQDPRPNIVVIMTDDMRVRDLRVMPNVRDLLGAHGTTFSTAYAPYALCCPSRASWLTGQYAHNNGVMGNGAGDDPEGGAADFDDSSTLATWLQDAGYQTALVGKYLNGWSLATGGAVPPGWQEWHALVGAGDYFNVKLRENTGGVLTTNQYSGVYATDLFDSKATDVIGRLLPAADPLFLWLGHFAPHGWGPVESDDPAVETPAVPPRWKDFYAGSALPKDRSFNEADVSDKPRYVRSRPRLTTSLMAQLREANAQRWESLRAVDESVGNVVEALTSAGELDNTVVVFSSDNGYLLGEHRLYSGKSVAYEASSRVPLIIRGPAFPVGEVRSPWVANIDMAPTLAALGEATPGLVVDGMSLLPLLDDPPSWPARTMVLERGPSTIGGRDSFHGVRAGRYKYVHHATGEVEFYDLRADPDEMVSLTADPSYDNVQASLARLLKRLEYCAGTACR